MSGEKGEKHLQPNRALPTPRGEGLQPPPTRGEGPPASDTICDLLDLR